MGALLGLDGEVGMVWRGLSGRGLSRATLCALLLVLLPTSATSPDEAWLPSASAEFRAGGQRKRSLACVVLGLRAGMRGGDGDSGGSMAGAGLQGWELSLDGRLLAAVREGREEALRPLVKAGANPNGVDPHSKLREAFIFAAAASERVEVLTGLLDLGAKLDVTDAQGNSPLHDAALRGRTNAAVALVEQGAKPDAENDYGIRPLHNAAINGHVTTVSQGAGRGGGERERTLPLGRHPSPLGRLSGPGGGCASPGDARCPILRPRGVASSAGAAARSQERSRAAKRHCVIRGDPGAHLPHLPLFSSTTFHNAQRQTSRHALSRGERPRGGGGERRFE
ncbi:ankyrin repeat-containing domain protein, partial [Baffinella frigidus]